MKFTDIITIPLRNLMRSKMRSFLTILSMMVGAFLIAILMSAGNGLEKFMVSQVTMFSNTRTISVRKQADFAMGFGLGGGVEEFEDESEETGESDEGSGSLQSAIEDRQLSNSDLEKVAEVEHVKVAEMTSFIQPDYVRIEDEESGKFKTTLISMPVELLEGLTFAVVDEDLLENDRSIVLSASFAEEWGEEADELVGEKAYVRVTRTILDEADTGNPAEAQTQGIPAEFLGPPVAAQPKTETKEFEFIIAGFTEKGLLGQMGFITFESDIELNAYIQNESVEEYKEDVRSFELAVIVDDEENVKDVDKAIEDLGYESDTYQDALGQIGFVFDVINFVLSGFGIVALVVASIGIANILLMAVYERTREIGVMKAVGATRRNISLLFTIEAGWLGFWGGLLGLGVSWGIGRVLNLILHEGMNLGPLSFDGPLRDYPTFDVSVMTWDLIIMVMIVTTVVALVAGLYPAWRAGRLNAIDALRRD